MDVIGNIHNDIHKGALQLIAEHREILLARARELCGNETDAEELVIRTIDKAIRKIDTYSGEGSVLGWMKVILENLHRNDCRSPVVKGTCAVDNESLEKLAGLDWKTDEEILAHSDSEALRAELERLDPKYSRVLLMRYYNGFSIREIARILNRPTGTVSRRLQIARQILAGKLGAKLGKAKKPLGVLAAVLLAAGAAFGLTKTVRWLAGERPETVEGAVAVRAESVVRKVQDVKEETKMNAKQVVASVVMAASVVSAGPLPEGYQQVDWIGLDGRQWLDTGFTPTSPKFGFMFDFVYANEVATSDQRQLLGSGENGVSGSTLKEFVFGCAERFFVSVNDLGERVLSDRAADARRLVDMTVGGKVTDDGVLTDWSLLDRELADSGSFCLFALRDQMQSTITGYAKERLYGCRMFLDGRVLRWFVPAKRLSDGKPGLYDAMNDKFYVNQGKGADFKGEVGGLLLRVY